MRPYRGYTHFTHWVYACVCLWWVKWRLISYDMIYGKSYLENLRAWLFMSTSFLGSSYPTSHGISDSVAPMGGDSEAPIKERVISDPMFYLIYLGVTWKKSARNLKIWARFQDFKILWNWDFASPWQTKNWHISFNFEDTGLKFYMQVEFL